MPTPSSERSLRAQIAAHESWANTADRATRTAPARKAALERFEKQVDPEGQLAPAERSRRAEHARKAYFKRLALKSAQARRKSREFAETAAAAERELAQASHADQGLPDADHERIGGEK